MGPVGPHSRHFAVHTATAFSKSSWVVAELACVMADGNVIQPDDITFSTGNTVNEKLLEEMTLDDYNRIIIKQFLQRYDNKVRLVASKLGIGKTTIYRLLKNEQA